MMNTTTRRFGLVRYGLAFGMTSLFLVPWGARSHAEDADSPTAATVSSPPETVVEARGRARLLHETIHGTLQVVHRDFFKKDSATMIPSRSLEDVFRELQRSHGVHVRWLAVNATAMSVDNKPRTPFEEDAVKAIASGLLEYESLEEDVYRFAGRIRLPSQCLSCHAPNRTNTKDRSAAVVISMPLKPRDRQ